MVTPRVRTILMEVTAYCACTRCCGPRARGLTASGKPVTYNGGRFVAADTRLLKFNTKLLIPGYGGGQPVEVIDRGGAIKGNKLDVFFDSHQEARRWGRQWLLVTVVE
jgi:3D (Asp-Asp-Asp) domain-containing protein